MGNNNATTQDNHYGNGTIADGYTTTVSMFEELGLGTLDPQRYTQLSESLDQFEANKWRWQGDSADTAVLRKHLAFTVFAPGGKAAKSREAIDLMDEDIMGPFFGAAKSRIVWHKVRDIVGPRVRFPNQKIKRFKHNIGTGSTDGQDICWSEIQDEMNRVTTTAEEKRRWLIASVAGLGHKASAHFMRNTGLVRKDNGFPIIDTHIIKVLKHYALKHANYTESEESFQYLAACRGVPILLLDAALWCGYAKNWDITGADFDNFTVSNP